MTYTSPDIGLPTSVRGRDICVTLFADITPKGSGASAQCPSVHLHPATARVSSHQFSAK